MDYCHACRRHLNGALACAGCGTPVEELRYENPHIAAPRQASAVTPAVTPAPEPAQAPAATPGPAPAVAPEHVYELDVVEPSRLPAGGRRATRTAARAVPRVAGGVRGRAGAARSCWGRWASCSRPAR